MRSLTVFACRYWTELPKNIKLLDKRARFRAESSRIFGVWEIDTHWLRFGLAVWQLVCDFFMDKCSYKFTYIKIDY